MEQEQYLEQGTEDNAEDYIEVNEEWKHGDDPQSHPMWGEQLDLEYGMMRKGADKLRDAILVAQKKGSMTDISAVNRLMVEWIPGVAQTLKDTIKSWQADKRLVPIVLPYMRDIDLNMAALVGLRETLDRIGQSKNTVTNIAMEIGRTIEYELRVRAWAKGSKLERSMWAEHQKRLKRDKVTTGHRRKVNINRFNHHLEEGHFDSIEWSPWSQEIIFRVGWTVLDAIVKFTGWFELEEDREHDKKRKTHRPRLLLVVKQGLQDHLRKATDHAEVNQPEFQPTVMPPKPWTSSREGGYWTPYVKPPRLVRFKASQQQQRENAADEYDSLEMPKVYRAVNALQDTAYRINTRILTVFSKVWIELRWSGEKACLPELSEREMPPRTARMDKHREKNKMRKPSEHIKPDAKTQKDIDEWKRKAAAVYSFNARRASRTKAASSMLCLAEAFAQYDAIYFPHMMDFRGRMYPIPAYLQPQGDDLARGLLTYADGMPITEENGGVRWLAIHVASVWGLDKASYEERVAWTGESEAFMRNIVADPYANDQWFHKADKPWEFLAACYEWVDFLDAKAAGKEFYSSLPIMVDGTCNGIQHLSALVRDEVGGKLVNLTPGDRPRDIYKVVAEDLQDVLESIMKAKGKDWALAKWWLDLCGGTLPRSLTKRQVMVLPYGGTREAFLKYTQKWLDENHPLPQSATKAEGQYRFKAGVFLTDHLWQAVKRNVRGAEQVMKWLKDCAKHATISNQPVFWQVPSGFIVRHFYGVLKGRDIKVMLDGTTVWPQVHERTKELSVDEQLSGISPNFVHSLDASALVETINLCLDAGIRTFTSVHDAYGTHAANMDAMTQLLREGFIMTHEGDPLGEFRLGCLRVMLPVAAEMAPEKSDDELFDALDARLPAPLDCGYLDLSEVSASPYFFS